MTPKVRDTLSMMSFLAAFFFLKQQNLILSEYTGCIDSKGAQY